MEPKISNYFKSKKYSSLRIAQNLFAKRNDSVQAINASIGNISLETHPKIKQRLFALNSKESPFKNGVIKYSETKGLEETNLAFLEILKASNCETRNLYTQVTDGASSGMEIVILGVSDKKSKPIMVIEPIYPNYLEFAKRLNRKIVSYTRNIKERNGFEKINFNKLEKIIKKEKPNALIIIPYDNPTGSFMRQKEIDKIALLAIKYNIWLISDEAYREIIYTKDKISSIWKIDTKKILGINGRRISIESASKVWNACGLRVGAIITDNIYLHQKMVAENSTNLCPNVIGQYVFSILKNEKKQEFKKWFNKQRIYYKKNILEFTKNIKKSIPNIIISKPESSIYCVLDFKKITPKDFDAEKFMLFCAEKGKVSIKNKKYTLLFSHMKDFYLQKNKKMGSKQVRLSFVEEKGKIKIIPKILKELLNIYLSKKIS